MPDDLIPTEADTDTGADSTDGGAAVATEPEQTEDSAYDDAYTESFGDPGDESDHSDKGEEQKSEEDDSGATEVPKPPAEPQQVVLTESERKALERAGLTEDFWKNWSRDQIETFVTKAREVQADNDRVRAELGRLKPEDDKDKPEQKAETKKVEPPEGIAKAIKKAMEGLTETFDDEIAPLGEALEAIGGFYGELHQQYEQAQQQLAVVNPLVDLVSDLVVGNALERIKDDYPSVDKPEGRKAVVDRFWTEWNTGAYSDPEKSIGDQLREAMTNAAKVTFLNTNEQTAAASLATKNSKRVQSQPKVGPQREHKRPATTEDDVYAEAFKEFLAE